MRLKHFACFLTIALLVCAGCSSHSQPGGPKLGAPGAGQAIDKSQDATLQQMIKTVLPEFQQLQFTDPKYGTPMRYSLFTPKNMAPDKKYPLVLFMADASTPGVDATSPLTQGYGALIWATPEAQAKNPCYVLVPQFSGVAVNDAYQHTPEVETVIALLEDQIKNNNVDPNRVYTTGQSMGGMISMYLNIERPELFAASMFVDCHWDAAQFGKLVQQDFIFVTAGDSERVIKTTEAIEDAARNAGRSWSYSSWSAKLPQNVQDSQAETILSKKAPIVIINFEPGTVLPENGQGNEHMYSFDYAYKLAPCRDWLFAHVKK